MSRNHIKEVKYLIEQEWTPSITGRTHQQEIDGIWYEIPDVTADHFDIVFEGTDRQENLNTEDYILIADTGTQEEYVSVGATEMRVDATAAVRVRSSSRKTNVNDSYIDGLSRLDGFFNDTGAAVTPAGGGTDIQPGEHERHGGMVGELTRCFQSVITPDQNWDYIDVGEFEPLHGNVPFGVFMKEAQVRLLSHAEEVDATV